MRTIPLALAVASAGLMMAGCGGGNGNENPPPPPPGEPDFITCAGNDCTISGDVTEDYTMLASRNWTLDGVVRVGAGNVTVTSAADVTMLKTNGVTLTIQAGTHIRATGDGVLLVTRGSKLDATGTALSPITFSSAEDDDFDGLGEWGGVIIQGFAPQYALGTGAVCYGANTWCNVDGEGGTFVGKYGGNEPGDDSGTLKYVRIAEAGLVAGPDDEVNGLTLQGVGYGTTIDYVQVHNNLDDGIEWFGGTVNVTHIVLTGNDDDDIDFDQGYKGNIQYAIVEKSPTKSAPTGGNDPRGIEANTGGANEVGATAAAISNVTLIGGPVNNAPNSVREGMLLRGGVTATIYNSAVQGFGNGCVNIDNGATINADIEMYNVVGDCLGNTAGIYRDIVAGTNTNTSAATYIVDGAYALPTGVATLGGMQALTAVDNGSGFTFDVAGSGYIGAVAPGTAAGSAWWAGWTIPGSLAAAPAPAGFVSCTGNDCTISGVVDRNYTLTADKNWTIDNVVQVGAGNVTVASAADVTTLKNNGVTLAVRQGASIKGADDGVLLVTRGSKLIALGTAAAPITFSSGLDANFDGLGEWGGVIIQGFAPQYALGTGTVCYGANTWCNVDGEGGTFVGKYGGNEPADNSGIIKYVRIAEAGLVAGPDDEVNGLTLQGVGYGTIVDYVQVHNNLDDGIEWFGGTVNVTHVVLTGNDDDDIDFDQGYKGNIQFAIVKKDPVKAAPTGGNDPRGIEANTGGANEVAATAAAIANVTLLGGPVNNAPNTVREGMLLRGGVTTTVYNSAVKGFGNGCVNIDNGATINAVIGMVNVVGDCLGNTLGIYRDIAAGTDTNTSATAFTLDAAFALPALTGDLVAAPTMTPVDNGSGFAFVATDYIGAVEPGTAAGSAWWANWTIPGSLP